MRLLHDGEGLAHGQFVDYITTNKKLSQNQRGNRKRHSMETALIDKSEVPVVVLLDMSQAFDSIRHDTVLHKLQSMGVAPQDWSDFTITCLVVARECTLGMLSQTRSLLNTEFLRVLPWGPCYLPST